MVSKVGSLFSWLLALYRSDAGARRLINMVFGLTILFIIVTILVDAAGYLRGAQLSVHRYLAIYMDRSIPEIYGYILMAATAVLLIQCYRRFDIRMFVFWACFFIFAVMDDAFLYHEAFGAFLVDRLQLPALPGLRPRDSGELVAWGLAAVFLLGPLAWSLLKRSAGTWAVFALFGVLVAALIVFAVGVDMLHEVFRGPMRRIVNWTEDGGELLVLSASFASALLISRSDGSALRS